MENQQARGETPFMSHIDELAFKDAAGIQGIVRVGSGGKTQAVTEELPAAPDGDTPDTKDAEENAMRSALSTDTAEFIALVEKSLEELKFESSNIMVDESVTPEQRSVAMAKLNAIYMIENPAALVENVGIYSHLGSLTTTANLTARFRSVCRTEGVNSLNFKELVASVKGIEDRELRQKMILMLNIVMLYTLNMPKKSAGREVFVRFQVAIIKYAVTLRVTPVLASVAYESYGHFFPMKK
jgi:hypothetical protein